MYSPYSVSSSNPSPPVGLQHHTIKPEPITAGLQHQHQVMHLGGPRLVIVEQPQKRFRFRYESELGGTHGQLAGRSGADRRSYPTVKLEGVSSLPGVSVRCDLYTVEEVPGISPVPHVHTLQGRNCSRGSAEIKIDAQTHFTASFQGLGIIHTAKKQMVEKIMCRKLDEEKMAIERSNPDKLWSPTERDIARVRELANRESQRINMNRVCLRFQAIMLNPKTMMPEEVCRPVYSDPIYNGKSAQTGELKIVQLSEAYSPCTGNKEIWLLVERVRKNDIRVRVYEEDENQQEVWCDYGRMVKCHHQYAIIFQTPAYRNKQLQGVVRVYIQLERPTDGCVSEPKNFQYTERDQRSTKRFCSMMDQPVAEHDSKSPDQALCVQPALQQRQQQPLHQGFMDYGIPGIADGLHKLQRAGYPNIIREAMLQQAQTVFPLYHQQHSMSQMGSPLTTHMGSPMGAQMASPLGTQMGSPMGTQMGSPMGTQMGTPMGGGGSVQMCTSPLSSKPSPQQMSASMALSGGQMTPLSSADSQHSQQMSPPVQFGIGGATAANMNQGAHAAGGLPSHNVPQTFNMPTNMFTNIRPQQMTVPQPTPASNTYSSGHANSRANVNYNNPTETNAQYYTEQQPQQATDDTNNANSAGSVLNEKELHDFLSQLPLDALAEGLCPNPAPKANKTPRGVAVRGIGVKCSNGVADPGDRDNVAREDEPQVQQQLEPDQKLSKNQEMNQQETKMLYTALDGQTFCFTASSEAESAALQDSMRFLTGLDSRDGDTPLHVASWYGRLDAVATLLQILNKLPEPLRHGIVNATNIRKQAAFHVACMGGFVDCVDLLLAAGAQSNLVDEKGNTGLHLASLGGATGVIERLLQEEDIAKLLLQTNYKGMSALHLAVLGGSLEAVSLLCVEGGADVNVRDDTEGRTCLHLAVSQGSVDMVRLLLNTPGIRVDQGTFGDTTPLQLACRLGSRQLTAMLVTAGADTSRRSAELASPPCEELLDTAIDDQEELDCEEEGLDAFMYARASGDHLLLDLLESRDKAKAYLTSLEREATDLPSSGDPCVTAAVENGHNQGNDAVSLQQGSLLQVVGDPSEGRTGGHTGGQSGGQGGGQARDHTGGHMGAQKVAERDDDMERPLSELLDADPAICRSLAELLELDSQAAHQVNSPAKYILNCVKKYNIPLSHLAHLLDCLGLQEANDLVMRNIVE